MKRAEYKKMAEREQNYWWHVGRLKIIESYLEMAARGMDGKITLLNVGCGTGGTLPTLEKFGKVTNVDVSDDAIKFMKREGHKVIKVEGIDLPFKDNTFSLVGAFDVLEHIDQDVDALREWRRVLKSGGRVVLTVPAYQWLWSEHDVSLHHFRRHTKAGVAKKAKDAGLKPVKISYGIVFSLPLIVGFRGLKKITGGKADSETSYVNVPDWVNNIFSKFLFSEAKGHKYISYPMGTSVVAILEKPSK